MRIIVFLVMTVITAVLLYYLIQCRTLTCAKNEAMKSLAIQAARWSIAAHQDKNPFIANLHANYGVAYAMGLRSIGTDKEIKNATGIEIKMLENSVINAQRKAAQMLFTACPSIIPLDDPYLAMLSQRMI